ncbi:hypothetical protein C8R46DRAFT_1082495 [Mycena filopes]|nr:hypothetical protein C8R46DRAFT_1082495 [Mycena filopes]
MPMPPSSSYLYAAFVFLRLTSSAMYLIQSPTPKTNPRHQAPHSTQSLYHHSHLCILFITHTVPLPSSKRSHDQ